MRRYFEAKQARFFPLCHLHHEGEGLREMGHLSRSGRFRKPGPVRKMGNVLNQAYNAMILAAAGLCQSTAASASTDVRRGTHDSGSQNAASKATAGARRCWDMPPRRK